MADVASALKDWSEIASDNGPSGTATVGAGLDDNLRQIQATVKKAIGHIVSVKDYGAVGDGVTDDAAAINAALAAAVSVYFPKPSVKYLVSSTLNATVARNISGDSPYECIIECSDNTQDILVFPDDADFVHVEGIGLQFATKGTGDGIVFTNSNNNLTVDRVNVIRADVGFNSTNVTFLQTYNGCRANECNTGFFAEGRTSGGTGSGTTLMYNQCYTNVCNTGFLVNAVREILFTQPVVQFDATNTSPTGISTSLCNLVQVKQISFEGTLGEGGFGVRCISSSMDILSIDGASVQITATGFDWYLYSLSNATGTSKVEVRNVSGRQAVDCKEYLMQNSAGGTIVLNKFNNDFGAEVSGVVTTNVVGEFIERDFDKSATKLTVVELFDDFIGDVIADQWNIRVGTDPQCTPFAIRAGQANGVIRGLTGDDAAVSMAVDGLQLESDTNWRPNQGGLVFECRISLPAVTFVSLFFGFTDQVAALEMPIHSAASSDNFTYNATDSVGVVYDTAMSTDNWWGVGVANGVAATPQNFGVAPSAATFEIWRIEVAKNGVATFYRNGAQIGTTMTGSVTTTAPLTPVVAAFSRAAAQRNVDIDFIMVQGKR